MKSLLHSIPLLLLLCTSAYAQKPNKGVEVKAQHNIYVYQGLGTGSRSLVEVYRKSSIPSIYATKDLRLTSLSFYQYTTEKPFTKAIFEVFNTNRLKELSTESYSCSNVFEWSG